MSMLKGQGEAHHIWTKEASKRDLLYKLHITATNDLVKQVKIPVAARGQKILNANIFRSQWRERSNVK